MELFGEQRGPRFPEDRAGDLDAIIVAANEELVEEELVGKASDLVVSEQVDLVDPLDVGERGVQGVFDPGVDHLRGVEHGVGLLGFSSDAILLLASDVFGDGFADDPASEPPAFLLEFGDAFLGPLHFGLRATVLLVELGAEAVADSLGRRLGHADRGVMAFDGHLNGFGAHVALLASAPSLLTAEAIEVEVLALGVREAEAVAATGTKDGALEVVVVDAALLSPPAMRGEDFLYPFEERFGYQCVVLARVLDALEGDQPEVVAVPQHVRDVGRLHGSGNLAAVRQGTQPLLPEGIREGTNGPFPGCVGLERPLNVSGAIRIDDDGADFATIRTDARVEVADGRASGGATLDRLLGHTLGGLGCEVLGVELGDAGHDGMQQVTGRGLYWPQRMYHWLDCFAGGSGRDRGSRSSCHFKVLNKPK